MPGSITADPPKAPVNKELVEYAGVPLARRDPSITSYDGLRTPFTNYTEPKRVGIGHYPLSLVPDVAQPISCAGKGFTIYRVSNEAFVGPCTVEIYIDDQPNPVVVFMNVTGRAFSLMGLAFSKLTIVARTQQVLVNLNTFEEPVQVGWV